MSRTMAVTVFLGIFVHASARVAFAENYSHWWDHPCDTPPDYGLTCLGGGGGESLDECYCDADWSDADNWTGTGYPDDTNDNPRIYHSNTGHCNGGSYDGDPCSTSGDCPGGTCDDVEESLHIRLSENLTTSVLSIDTSSTGATTDALDLALYSNTGSKTLTVDALHLDATNGAIHVSTQATELKTTTSD